jgi:chemotaxis signal transduction protein
MSEKLLKLRWSSEEYGVPVNDVSGIIRNAWASPLPISQNYKACCTSPGGPLPLIGPDIRNTDWGHKRTVIMHSNGIQMALIVDQILDVIGLNEGDAKHGAQKATFKIWRLVPRRGTSK